MNRIILGFLGGLLLAGLATFWLQGRAQVEAAAPPPEPKQSGDLSDTTAIPVVDMAGLEGPTPPEASELSREQKRFFRYDRNYDWRISRTEMLSSRTPAFQKLDKDGNNLLTFEEWAVATVDKFENADSNKDRELTPAEFASTRPKKAKSKPACSC